MVGTPSRKQNGPKEVESIARKRKKSEQTHAGASGTYTIG